MLCKIESACMMNISHPGPPQAPEIRAVRFTADNFTVEWQARGESADNFTFDITPNDFYCTRSSLTTATCPYSRVNQGQVYIYTVAALNCGSQRGDESTGRVELQGMSLTIKTYHFYQCTERDRYILSYK